MESYTVSALLARLSATLDEAFPSEVWIEGEIGDLRRSNQGHVYFRLIEPRTEHGAEPSPDGIGVVLFAGARRAVNKMLVRTGTGRMDPGMQIRIRGRMSFYPAQGRVEVHMTAIDPRHTLGALSAAREQVVAALRADGLLDRNQRLPVPLLPLRIALVTAPGSAALADFLGELDSSGRAFVVRHAPCLVQGTRAPASIEAAIEAGISSTPDLLVVIRGGGSASDLSAFDSERVARALARAPVPVVTGIGHETDHHVADDVAHTACKTPTAAAVWIIDRVATVAADLDQRRMRLIDRARTATTAATAALDRRGELVVGRSEEALRLERVRADHAGQALHHHALHVLERHRSDVERRSERVSLTARGALDRAGHGLATRRAEVDGHDPERLLRQGWSVTRTTDGRTLRSLSDVQPGDLLVTTVLDGEVSSVVIEGPPAPEVVDP